MSERLTTRLANGGVGYDNGEYFKFCYPWNEHCLMDIDRIDSLATHCRYCGAKMREERKENER